MEVPAEEQGAPAPHWAAQPTTPVLESGVPITSDYENHQGFHRRWRAAGDLDAACLKGPKHRFTCSQIHSFWTLAQRQQLENARIYK